MQRTLSAILALDVVDYSRHMGRDDEATLAEMRSLFARIVGIVELHHGRVFSDAGDSVMAIFLSPVEALRAALHIRDLLLERREPKARLHLRQALALGDVIVEGHNVYGDAVNIAARLQTLAEPDGIVVSRGFYDQVQGHVAADFLTIGKRQLKNIAVPVEVLRLSTGAATGHRLRNLGVGVGMLGIALAAGLGWQFMGPGEAESQLAHLASLAPLREQGHAIAVTSFDWIGDDARVDTLGEGLVEDVTTDLSKIQSLQVVARNTIRSVARETVGARVLAEALGVSHVLEGTIRSLGDQIRLNVRLIDGTDGLAVWGERYDVSPERIFDVEKAIVQGIVSALALNLSADEQQRIARRDTADLDAYESFRRGWSHLQAKTPDDLAEALRHLEEAVALDPGYAAANAAIGQVYWWSWVYGWEDSVGETWETAPGRAEEYLQRALLQPNAVAYQLAADMNLYARRFDEAIGFARLAVEHDPNDVTGHIVRAETLIYAGRPAEGRPWVELAMRLDPLFPPYVNFVLGMAQFGQEDFSAAVEQLELALSRNPDDFGPAAPLAAALFHLDRHEAAKQAFETYRAGWPEANIDEIVEYWPYQFVVDEERLIAPLRALGLPRSPPG